jgi:hypothetical protein
MKPCASWACDRFVSGALFAGARVVIVKPVLDVLAGVGAFENHLGHRASLALRGDGLLICRKSHGGKRKLAINLAAFSAIGIVGQFLTWRVCSHSETDKIKLVTGHNAHERLASSFRTADAELPTFSITACNSAFVIPSSLGQHLTSMGVPMLILLRSGDSLLMILLMSAPPPRWRATARPVGGVFEDLKTLRAQFGFVRKRCA